MQYTYWMVLGLYQKENVLTCDGRLERVALGWQKWSVNVCPLTFSSYIVPLICTLFGE